MRAIDASRNRNRYLRRFTSITGYAVPLTVKMSPTKPWFGKCLKNVLPHHSGCVRGLPAAGNSLSWMSLWIVTPSSRRQS